MPRRATRRDARLDLVHLAGLENDGGAPIARRGAPERTIRPLAVHQQFAAERPCERPHVSVAEVAPDGWDSWCAWRRRSGKSMQ